MAAVKSEARRRRAVATCYPGAAEEARGPGAGARTGISVVQVAILLYLRRNGRNADDRAGWCDCCSCAAGDEQPRRGGRLGFGSMGDEACGAAAGNVCVCGGGCGKWGEVGGGLATHQKAMSLRAPKQNNATANIFPIVCSVCVRVGPSSVLRGV